MNADTIPSYSVQELNTSVGALLERGFAPRFLVHGSALRPQIKKGHLWLTLSDGSASITVVCWASRLQQLNFVPAEGEGVTVVGKLNFWAARASLAVQAIDLRPSRSTIERRFEAVKALLSKEGLIDSSRQRSLPLAPQRIALLTSVPSSALADMLRTAKERWPLTELLVIPIPVQGDVAPKICSVLERLAQQVESLRVNAVVLARGGGSREDLMVFDDEVLCRTLAHFPVPVVTGLGHEDDLTVADLVADFRAATPTAAIVSLLPTRSAALQFLSQCRRQLLQSQIWRLRREEERLIQRRDALIQASPTAVVVRRREHLEQRGQLLQALSPQRWLARGFATVTRSDGHLLQTVADASPSQPLVIHLSDGEIDVSTVAIRSNS
ncbi:exodeoxyribonuclease VII/ large subunit [Synechococcus sp. MEDNS5]|uniref:exodeoxyribonuclease VII large subunit n=1 Tax=Synechococcus sp. MEDNS5 TaxID=1442554 RepID=UPI001644BAD2|nr:exodeoxyribonuclease VII large subunit [Synechococcus sp. MEDNS5]QNJ07114.1 exodeoxyribonuclease VII/ large subunit [Synechococcus sp. MEDNS5]